MTVWRDQAQQSVLMAVAPGAGKDPELALHSHGKMRACEEALALLFGVEQ